jgi:ferric-dicitrate binding protein FerR (iron transport regulator)
MSVRREAEAWVAKLSRTSISNDELAAFFTWRRDPENGPSGTRWRQDANS